MGNEKRGREARRRQPVQLIVADGLGMDERVPAVRAGIFGLRGFQRIQRVVHGAVPVGVDKELSLAMRRLDDGKELFTRIGRVTAPVRIAPERRMVGPGKIGCEALDGAVAHDLDAAAPHPVATALQAGIVPVEIVIGIIVDAHGQQAAIVGLQQGLRAVVVQHAGVQRRGDAPRGVDLA